MRMLALLIAGAVIGIAGMMAWDRYEDHAIRTSGEYQRERERCEIYDRWAGRIAAHDCWRAFDRRYGD